MGKRYYCDYCDKSFADNASNRRNHLTGVFHQKNRKDHYDSFVERDPANILAEASRLPLCNSFKSTDNSWMTEYVSSLWNACMRCGLVVYKSVASLIKRLESYQIDEEDRAGECRFGHNCRWSHVTDEVRADLERQIQAKREASERLRKKDEVVPTLEEWLEKRKKKKVKTESGSEEKDDVATDNPAEFQLPVYTVPPILANFPALPPSLLPPPPDAFKYLPMEEWG